MIFGPQTLFGRSTYQKPGNLQTASESKVLAVALEIFVERRQENPVIG